MAPVSSIGVDFLAYAGYVFSTYTSNVTAKPVRDSSGRTTRHVDFDIKVDRALVEAPPGGTTDNELLTMRRALTKTGQHLEFTAKGYGPFDVNGDGPMKDVDFGPHPQLLGWNPTGNDQAAMVSWQCKTSLPQCDDARFEKAIAELNYTVEHRIDIDGYPTISVSGHLDIAMTRESDTRIPDHVDNYRERVETPVPLGFQRRDKIFRFNEAKNRVDFSWVDEGLRAPLPESCTQVKLDHRFESEGPAFVQGKGHISATITVPPNVEKMHAMRVFMSVIQNRAQAWRRGHPAAPPAPAPGGGPPAGGGGFGGGIFGFALDLLVLPAAPFLPAAPPPPPAAAAAQQVGFWMPTKFSARNGTTARDVTFDLAYNCMSRFNLVSQVQLSGIWLPIPGSSWTRWRDSMLALGVCRVRGPHGLRWSQADEAILDLCVQENRPAPPPPRLDPHVQPFNFDNEHVPGEVAGAGGSEIDPASPLATLPNPDASWLGYANSLTYLEPKGRYARHRPLAGAVTETPGIADAAGEYQQWGRYGLSPATAQKSIPDILQEVDAPAGLAYVSGQAVRIGASTVPPNLLTCRGAVARRNRVLEHTTRTVSRYGDLPIMHTKWVIEFMLEKPPEGPMPVLADPTLGVRGGTMTR